MNSRDELQLLDDHRRFVDRASHVSILTLRVA
jgi:hypothetical protein